MSWRYMLLRRFTILLICRYGAPARVVATIARYYRRMLRVMFNKRREGYWSTAIYVADS